MATRSVESVSVNEGITEADVSQRDVRSAVPKQ
jgi:hypothetical protein